MKKIITLLFVCALYTSINAQYLSLPPSGDNQKSSVTQWIGPVSVNIMYNSPNVTGPRGEDRKGHIWGELVPYGFTDPDYGTSKSAPWRAGANESTTIEFSHDVVIEGKKLNAGKYGLFLVVENEGPWTWILSTDADSWGMYHYTPEKDALRVQALPKDAPYTEYLTYSFDERLPSSAIAFLQWENKRVDLKIEVQDVNNLHVEQMRAELYGKRLGFFHQSWVEAAQFCARNKVNLEEALQWADYALTGRFIGVEEFSTLQTKAMVLEAMGRNDEAEVVMSKAINHPTATVQAIHQYGRTLLASGKNQKALEVFLLNRKRHPGDKFTTYVGLARGYTATGDKKNAIKNWETALKNIPAEQKPNLPQYEAELKKLRG